MEQNSEIIICPSCKGVGLEYVKNKNGTIAVSRGKPMTQECSLCGGDRCVLLRTTKEMFRLSPNIIEEEKTVRGSLFSWMQKK